MTELSTLERKPLSDLHQIAAQLGIEQYRKYRKPQLAELIYKTATEQAVGQQSAEATTNGDETAAPTLAPEETATNGATGNGGATTPVSPAPPAATETHMDPFGESDTAIASPEEVEERRQQQRGRDRSADRQTEQRRDGRADRGDRRQDGRQQEGQGQSGILDVLPDGFGFLRTNGYSQGKGDVYVSTSQIKRFNLRRGDYVVGQIRPARDGEKYPALVRIESVNGHEPQKGC